MMRALLWKEYREHRLVALIGLAVFLTWPMLELAITSVVSSRPGAPTAIAFTLAAGPIFALVVGALTASREAGWDNEAFTFSRPVPLGKMLGAKFICGIATVCVASTAPVVITQLTARGLGVTASTSHLFRDTAAVLVLLPWLLLPVYTIGLLAGALLRSTAKAVLAGLLVAVTLFTLPLVVPRLESLNLPAALVSNGRIGQVSVTHYIWNILIVTGLASACLAGAYGSFRRDWQVRASGRTMAWTLATGLCVLLLVVLSQLRLSMGVLAREPIQPVTERTPLAGTQRFIACRNCVVAVGTVHGQDQNPAWAWLQTLRIDDNKIRRLGELIVRDAFADPEIQWTGTSEFLPVPGHDVLYATEQGVTKGRLAVKRLAIIDLSDPAHPAIVSRVNLVEPLGRAWWDMTFLGDRLLVAHLKHGVSSIMEYDISDPLDPRPMGVPREPMDFGSDVSSRVLEAFGAGPGRPLGVPFVAREYPRQIHLPFSRIATLTPAETLAVSGMKVLQPYGIFSAPGGLIVYVGWPPTELLTYRVVPPTGTSRTLTLELAGALPASWLHNFYFHGNRSREQYIPASKADGCVVVQTRSGMLSAYDVSQLDEPRLLGRGRAPTFHVQAMLAFPDGRVLLATPRDEYVLMGPR